MAGGPPAKQKTSEAVDDVAKLLADLEKAVDAATKKQEAAERDPDKVDALQKELTKLIRQVDTAGRMLEKLQKDLGKDS